MFQLSAFSRVSQQIFCIFVYYCTEAFLKLLLQQYRHTSIQHLVITVNISLLNLLTPNVNYSGRTAPLTSKVVFYIFIQQI